MSATTAEIIHRLPAAFVPGRAAGVDAAVQLRLLGNGGGDWVITIRNQTCTVAPGMIANPNVHISADADDFKDMMAGSLNPMQALMFGRLRVQGDMGLAARFPSMFRA